MGVRIVEPSPEFVEQLDATQRVAGELLSAARELMVLANQLINHANLQWARYSAQLYEAEQEEARTPQVRKVKVKRSS